MEEGQKGLSLGDALLLLFGAGMAYKIYKGKTSDILLFPLRILFLVCLIAFVLISVIKLFLPIILPIFIIYILYQFTTNHPDFLKRFQRLRPTQEQLDKVYDFAMRDLENGKISEEQFLRVAGRVREIRATNNG